MPPQCHCPGSFQREVHVVLCDSIPAAEPAALLGPTAADVAVPPRLSALTLVTALLAATVVDAAKDHTKLLALMNHVQLNTV